MKCTQTAKVAPLIPTHRFRERLSIYAELSKMSIVILVLLSSIAGFFVGHSKLAPVAWDQFGLTLLGIFFLASAASALNQLQEIRIDQQMPRTQSRPLASGRLSKSEAIALTLLMMGVGLACLYFVNLIVFWEGVATLVLYNGLYTLWWKRNLAFAAIPGALPGAMPILMGFSGATQTIWDPAGLYLFALLFVWQMPHFWVLALRYQKDYRLGGIPTLPVVKGEEHTKVQILLWGLAYMGVILLAPAFLPVGILTVSIGLIVVLRLSWILHDFFRSEDLQRTWLRFFLSVNFSYLLLILTFALDSWRHPILDVLFS